MANDEDTKDPAPPALEPVAVASRSSLPLANTLEVGGTLPAPSAREPDDGELRVVSPSLYTDRQMLGGGAMGRIFTARDKRMNRIVAIKELRTQSPALRARLVREALLTARLGHPNIVSVHEAGQWPSGDPFYAMKLVEGRPFDQVIAGAKSLGERVALLPYVIAIADALAYAHQERVIHRDLKPKNVMVGQFGETVVIDWGLGKQLDEPDPDGDGARPPHDGDAETKAGDVLGTPAYMPPEQANGVPADERSDVYSIGAILYHVLVGEPPYTGTNQEILEAVKRGPPPPARARQPDAPEDLLAIVDRAMSREPAARYPTGRELAEDLRRFQAGQLVGAHRYSLRQLMWRWLRRHRAAVAVGATAAVVLATVGAFSVRRVLQEQRRAESARVVAEKSRGEAEDMMDFMLFDLRDKLEHVGRLDLLESVARKAGSYYDFEPALERDADRHRRGKALRNLGDVLLLRGDAPGALTRYRQALGLVEEIAARDPTNGDWQRDVAVSHDRIGNALQAVGDSSGALAAYRAQLAIVERLVAGAPARNDWQRDLTSSHNQIGDVLLAQGDTPGALAAYRAGLSVAEALAARDPASSLVQHDRWVSRIKIGQTLLAQGDAPGGLAEYRRALEIIEAVAAREPASTRWRRDVGVSRIRVGDALVASGQSAEALSSYRSALVIADELARHDPSNGEWQTDASIAHDKVGGLLLAQGDTAGALAEFNLALAFDQKLVARDPSNADWQRGLALTQTRVGSVLHQRGDFAAALAQFRASLAIRKALAAQDPKSAARQRDLASGHDRIGDALLAQKDTAGALTEYRAALAIRAALASQDPTNADAQRDLAIAHDGLGTVLADQNDFPGALQEFRSSLSIVEKLVANDPANVEWQRDLAVSHVMIGDIARMQGDVASGMVEYRRALQITERLVAQDPNVANWHHDLSLIRGNIGDLLFLQGDVAGALAEHQAALAIADKLAARDRSNAVWQQEASALRAKVERELKSVRGQAPAAGRPR